MAGALKVCNNLLIDYCITSDLHSFSSKILKISFSKKLKIDFYSDDVKTGGLKAVLQEDLYVVNICYFPPRKPP